MIKAPTQHNSTHSNKELHFVPPDAMRFPRKSPFYAYLGSAVSPVDVVLKCKCGVYEYGESASLLADLPNELGAYFAMHLCQLNAKGLRGFARLKNPKSFNEL